jgi:tetratricopeptide (TPR) repeat protein
MSSSYNITESELSGYLELGMMSEAERLARAYLTNEQPSGQQFGEAMDAILVSAEPSRWKAQIEKAYKSLSRDHRSAMRFKMLSFYWSLSDLKTAEDFLSWKNGCDPAELLIAMEIYLESGRIQEAGKVARKCERVLKAPRSDFDEGMLRTALGNYYGRQGQPVRALNCLTEMPLNSPFLRNALVTTVELSLLPALTALDRGFDAIARKKQDPDLSIELQMPRLEDELMAEIERDLRQLKRKLEKIVSPSRQRELGIASAWHRSTPEAFSLASRTRKK